MKPLVPVVLTALALGGVALLLLRYRQHGLVAPYSLVVRSVEDNAAEGRRLGLTPVSIGAQRALMRRPSSGKAWLLYWGGNTDSYFKEAVEGVAALSLPPEVGVLIVAPPGYDSEGRPSPEGVDRNALEAREWLRTTEGAEKIVLGSFSMGCFSVFAAAYAHVDGAMMVGVSDSLDMADPGRLMRLRTPDHYDRKAVAPTLPALIIQGTLDFPEEAHVVTAWWPGSREVMVPDAGHADSRLHPLAVREQRAFLAAHLGVSLTP